MMYLFESIVNMQEPFNMVVLIVLIVSMAGVMTAIATEIRKFFAIEKRWN